MSQPEGQVVDLAITGMHCPSCAALIEETLGADDGVTEATVDLAAARARITFDPTVLGPDRLCALVAEAGYQAEAVGPVPC
jgi:copper chaperone CopZ